MSLTRLEAIRQRQLLQRATSELKTMGRVLDRRPRMSPDFLVVGAQKAGTSSLFAYLASYPTVAAPVSKEIRYFSQDYRRGHRWYLNNFPLLGTGVMTGEATPVYLDYPLALERIRADLPSVKVVTILRDPVDRLVSHYRHAVRHGREPLSLPEALHAEAARIAPDLEALAADSLHPAREYLRHAYLARSLYSTQVARVQELFPGRSFFLRLEDLTDVTRLAPLCEFLEIGFDPRLPAQVHNANASRTPLEPGQVPQAFRALLDEDSLRTTALLGWEPWPHAVGAGSPG